MQTKPNSRLRRWSPWILGVAGGLVGSLAVLQYGKASNPKPDQIELIQAPALPGAKQGSMGFRVRHDGDLYEFYHVQLQGQAKDCLIILKGIDPDTVAIADENRAREIMRSIHDRQNPGAENAEALTNIYEKLVMGDILLLRPNPTQNRFQEEKPKGGSLANPLNVLHLATIRGEMRR